MSRHSVKGPVQLANLSKLVAGLNPDKAWAVTIAEAKSRRSLEQNDRFHALIASIARETGHDPAFMKAWAVDQFGPIISGEIDGKHYEVPKPTHTYDVAEMSEVMDRLEAWAATELGIAA